MKTAVSFFAVVLICIMLLGCSFNPAAENVEATHAPVSAETVAASTTAETENTVESTAPFVVEIRPVITETLNSVTVTTADEFLDAIAPNTEIIVDAELIDLSMAAGYGETDGEYYSWSQAYDGPELYISEVSNLVIRGIGEDRTANVISSVPRYSNVLNFLNCSKITVEGLTVGHTEEEGYCTGGVLRFMNCEEILVQNCGLFGCGTVGVRGESSRDIQIINNDIYDCSVGGIDLAFCDDVNADGNTFRELGNFTFRVYDCGSVTCNDEPVFDSYHGR